MIDIKGITKSFGSLQVLNLATLVVGQISQLLHGSISSSSRRRQRLALSRIIGNFVDRGILRNEDDAPGVGYYVTSFILDLVLGFLASMVVAAFSRHREFRADAGAAKIMGSSTPMINALARLGGVPTEELPGAVKGFGIAGSIGQLLATHPSIEDRIAALRTQNAH